MNFRWSSEGDWAIAGGARGTRRGTALAGPRETIGGELGTELDRVGIEIAIQQNVVPRARRGLEKPALDFTVECAPRERVVTILRHPSGATTFHAPLPVALARRSRGPAAASLHFHIELAEQAPLRRGLISSAIKMIVVKVREKLIDAAVSAGLQAAALKAEALWWRQRKLTEGWHGVAAAASGCRLTKVKPGDMTGPRSLLFLHGTFSDTVGSFGAMLRPKVLAQLLELYEGRIFCFEHFSVSRSPEENARALLDFLPDRENLFDVISYSRGGVVLRTLTEQAQGLGGLGRRFRLNRGVLIAVPNGGTPLATGRRWEDTFGLLSTLLDMVPDGPHTPLATAAAFIADGLVWLAGHLSGDLPGLEAMDADSAVIAALQQHAEMPYPNYSAIGANYHPTQSVWQKLLDGGVDGFFAGANDLVVPTDGALAVDPGGARVIPVERVACFGPGGNLRMNAGDVHHLSILAQDETAAFVLRALRGESQSGPTVDLDRPIPSRKPWRGGGPAFARPEFSRRESQHKTNRSEPQHEPAQSASFGLAPSSVDLEGDRTLHLMIISDPTAKNGKDSKGPAPAQIIAMYGSARVVEPFGLRDAAGEKGAGTRFSRIIRLDERIQMNLEGRISRKTLKVPELPDGDLLRDFGALLFESLFLPRVRRLYDLARSEQRGRPLNVIFTCTIPWVASKPWEFAFDPNRRKFLATEEIHFVRNVLTAVPAQRLNEGREKLRLLVVEAQPAGTAELAVDEEERQIRFRFQPLIEAGLVEVDILARATPERLHEMIVRQNLEERPYDVVHFIGHGEFDREASQGRLLFHSSGEGYQTVETQTLRELLCNRRLQLVFLNACDTARDAKQKLNRGVASALVEGGLPAVVANQYKVLDPSAVAFAQQFYWALANGATLGEAAREARIAVNYSIEGEIIDWAVPVLYARDPDRRLCVRKDTTVPLKRPASRPSPSAVSKPAAVKRRLAPLIVGIADLARYFTGMEDILVRLNSVQNRFVFRLVEINTPMGVWEHDNKNDINRLYAERFAEKLRNKPKALGVDLLGCITNWWMRDDDTLNIYGWWSGDAEVPLLIFSTAGLALPTHGPAAGRVVANELVCGIGCQLAESNANRNPIHEDPPTNCPFYYNPERDVAKVAGRLKISKASRAVLMKTLPADIGPRATVAAFNALLAAFDGELGAGKQLAISPKLKVKTPVAPRGRKKKMK
jgi:hypothetical protein